MTQSMFHVKHRGFLPTHIQVLPGNGRQRRRNPEGFPRSAAPPIEYGVDEARKIGLNVPKSQSSAPFALLSESIRFSWSINHDPNHQQGIVSRETRCRRSKTRTPPPRRPDRYRFQLQRAYESDGCRECRLSNQRLRSSGDPLSVRIYATETEPEFWRVLRLAPDYSLDPQGSSWNCFT